MSRLLIDRLVQPHLLDLQPYATARHEFGGRAEVFLDANENPFPENAYNRYPDPLQVTLRNKLAEIKNLRLEQVFTGQGSDEAIDLLCRLVGRPGKDEVLVCQPTYGVYAISAAIQHLRVKEIPLTAAFQPDVTAILKHSGPQSKLLFLCSPNNPTGNLIESDRLLALLNAFPGLVVVDEAYIDFAGPGASVLPLLAQYPKLVVLQTLSKAWGQAGLRLGMAFGHPRIVELMQRIKAPYNLATPSQQLALQALQSEDVFTEQTQLLVRERERLSKALNGLPEVLEVFPSAANFLLVRFEDAKSTYDKLLEKGIIVRDRSRVAQLENCLRITVGTPQENQRLLATLQSAP